MKRLKLLFLILYTSFYLLPAQTTNSQIFYNAKDLNIVNDGKTLNTKAIKESITMIAEKGGGTLYFPAGTYLTGPIYLKSNITLYLEAGSVLKFSSNFEDYLPMVKSRWEGTEVINFSPQIYAYEEENIAIRGRGLIDGQGEGWWQNGFRYTRNPGDDEKNGNLSWQKEFLEKNKDTESWASYWENYRRKMPVPFLRPPMIQPLKCKNILIEGVSIQNPPFWTINPVYCENITVTDISIKNPEHSPNTDGINPESCRYVRISNSHISVGDDCITIKSGRDVDGRKVGRPCENITITNCTMLDGHGGVVIGSEMSGSVRKVTISNCVFDGTDRGIRMKTMRGRGGTVEEIRVSNIVMKNIAMEAIKLNMAYHPTPEEPVSERTPQFKNIHLSDITITQSKQAGFIYGLPEMPVENITFNNINIESEKGFTIENARHIEFHNIDISPQEGPAFYATNSIGLEFNDVSNSNPKNGDPVIELSNIKNALIQNNFSFQELAAFLKVSGEKSENLIYKNNHFVNTAHPIIKADDVPEKALIK